MLDTFDGKKSLVLFVGFSILRWGCTVGLGSNLKESSFHRLCLRIFRVYIGLLCLNLPIRIRAEDSKTEPKNPKPKADHHATVREWQRVETAPWLEGRQLHSSVWTGGEILIWGGAGDSNWLNSGARYKYSVARWNQISTNGAPSARCGQSAVWTGSQWLIWGGYEQSSNPLGTMVQSGGVYEPSNDRWTPLPTHGSPSPRADHVAVWTGDEMIIWGGRNQEQPVEGGGRFNPRLNLWISMSRNNSPSPRFNQTMIWTGKEAIVWGGYISKPPISTAQGYRYRPERDEWTVVSEQSAPVIRENHTAVWTGSEMILWGGNSGDTHLNTGARYDPRTDSWRSMSALDAPSPRKLHTGLWTGKEMLVWGGEGADGNPADWGLYDPTTDSWKTVKPAKGPQPRTNHGLIRTPHGLILTGGQSSDGELLNDIWKISLPNTKQMQEVA